MASVTLGAGADRFVVLNLTIGTCTTGSYTRIDTLKLEASLITTAVVMSSAFGEAPAVGVSLVKFGAIADCAAVSHFTISSLTTSLATGIHTDIVPASHAVGALCISHALGAAASERIANVVVNARAHGAVIANLAVGVLAAWGGMAQFLRVKSPASGERISDEASRARANGLVIPDGAIGSCTAKSFLARVDTPQSLAGKVARAIVSLNTFSSAAVGEGISFIADGTGAHRAFSAHSAVSIVTTGGRCAGI